MAGVERSQPTPGGGDAALTVAGVFPVGADGSDTHERGDPLEEAALQRVMARLVPGDYQPVRLGRFVLLERLGAGGMGVVHAGYDDMLDRRVALKLIGGAQAGGPAARKRLFREAQAMAKLSHANVVQVFEAGDHDGHLFIAMELVEGRTLRAWCREAPRRWPEIVRLFVQIGEGLAAAHAAGVVHRDFKPDNVLIGKGDVPKVADFGLATLAWSPSAAGDSTAGDSTAGSTGSGSTGSGSTGSGGSMHAGRSASGAGELLTRSGEVMGTPAYMPPEQCIDRVSDATSDQFSFCVALYEALYGERPFTGDTLAQIVRHVVNGEIQPAPARTEVPAWLRACVLRGLSARRRDRFPSMRAVVNALGDDPRVRRRRALLRWGGAAVVVGSVGAGVAVVQLRPQPCADAGVAMDERWNDAVRGRVSAALSGTGVAYARDTASRVDEALDRWTDRWRAEYRDACEATQIAGVQSEAAMDLRIGCLDRAASGLVATLEQLVVADAGTVERAMRLVGALPRLSTCGDLDALRARVAPPDDPEVAAAVAGLQAALGEAQVLHLAGRIDAAEQALRALQGEADRLRYRPLRSEVDEALGALLVVKPDLPAAETLYRVALAGALADGDDAVAMRAAAGLVMVLGSRATRFAEAEWLGALALALAERGATAWRIADIHNSMGGLRINQGRYALAEVEFRTGLEALLAAADEDDPEVAVLRENLGTALGNLGRLEESLVEHRRALDIREAVFGPEHPLIATGRTHLGASLQALGRYDEAELELRAAIDLLVLAFGPAHPDVAMGRVNLAVVLDELGRHREAQAEYRSSIAILERTDGAEHPQIAQVRNNLGTSFEDEGRLVEAEAEYRAAIGIARGAYGERHPDVARTYGNLGSVLVDQGRLDEAVDAAELALAISKDVLDAGHPDLLYAYREACSIRFERVKWAERAGVRGAALADIREARVRCEAGGPEAAAMLEALGAWPPEPG